MNRIQLWPQAAAAPAFSLPHVSQALVHHASSNGVSHTLFAPLHYEPNYAYPLLVWLHGPGDDERQLQRVMPLVSMRNYVAAGPRGVCLAEGGLAGYCWLPTDEAIAAATQSVFDCLEAASDRFNVAPSRIFLGGYQCGGSMALRIALAHCEKFAGAISIGGPFPTGRRPLARLDLARRLPLFLAQGRESELYPIRQSCEEIRLFHAAGMSVSLRQYPCGDELTTQMLHDLNVWMMERVTGVEAVPDESQTVWSEFN